ncbi:glycoside hydrolase family protein [Nostoc linckia NIES-25]|nr:glycoside hydrolase family protein [Nostoc linckia NIES-25]
MTSAAQMPANGSTSTFHSDRNTHQTDPLKTAHGVYVTVHGHFYQPPRENPYLDAIERQPSAAPFHDWNERIHWECYRPNAFARVLNDRGEVMGIVNNYEYFSFNIGPTLMSWLERYDLEVYQRILEADAKSSQRLHGHGNAIAQVYNHIIMPLANERDKYTQIRWGKEDFRSRFGRDPEGMWLAETGVDYPTLEALVAEGIRFVILAPSQAQRCRPFPTKDNPNPEWYEVGGSQIDPTRPYRCYLNPTLDTSSSPLSTIHDSSKDGSREGLPYIDIFFYDGPISRDMGFSDVVYSANRFAGRIGSAVRGDHRPAQLISVATDGETFGHHKKGTEKTLAYAFTTEFPEQGWTVTNFAHYLSLNSPTWEVELKPITAWSCAHGVDRWQDNCGCGGEGGVWHQKWRRPLRDALNWLRDQLIEVYEEYGRLLFRDPWQARDEYIQVMRDRTSANVNRFLSRHQTHKLTAAEQVDALRLLEMQRHALLMFTSCGWFFEEISRPEGTQILRYAARALELAGEVAGVQLEKGFVKHLGLAPSNVDQFKHGGEIYRQLVLTAQLGFKQVAAHYAISSLFTNQGSALGNGHSMGTHTKRVYCYAVNELDYQLQRMGSLTLAVGNLKLVSEITWESEHLVFAVLHLGGWDFHCCIQQFTGRRDYTQLKEKVFGALQQASAAHTILAMTQFFGEDTFSLENLFAEERHRIMRLLSQETLTRLGQLYTQVYRDNYGVLMAFHRDEISVPQELQVAAEIALGHRCMMTLRSLEQDITEPQMRWNHIVELEAIATEAKHLRCRLNIPDGKQILEQLIVRSLWQLLHDANGSFNADIQQLERLIDIGDRLNIDISLHRSQELYFSCLHSQIIPLCLTTLSNEEDIYQCRQLLKLGKKLAVDISMIANQFP